MLPNKAHHEFRNCFVSPNPIHISYYFVTQLLKTL